MARKTKVVEDEEDDDPVVQPNSKVGGKQNEKGLNYAAIALMVMFGLPMVLALVVQASR